MKRIAGWALAGLMAVVLAGCEADEKFDHKPPAGMGSILVNNHTGDDIDVYFNGGKKGYTRHYDWEAYDVAPGLYRVVLDDDDGDNNWRGDVDVLTNQLTVLDVYAPKFSEEYDVSIYFEEP